MTRRPTIAVLVAAGLLASAAPAAAVSPRLTPRLAALTAATVRALPQEGQSAAVGLPRTGPGSLQRAGQDVVVSLRLDPGAPDPAAALRAAGADDVRLATGGVVASARVAPADLEAVAAVAGVRSVREVLRPVTRTFAGSAACHGARTSAGDVQLRAADARAQDGVDGTGAKVVIISDSFDVTSTISPQAGTSDTQTTEAGDELTADLPGPGNPCGRANAVQVLDDATATADDTPADEGRAMAQIVHDLAPGAALAFASAGDTDEELADRIRALRAAGATTIVDDVAFLDEPFFQDGPESVAVDDVTAGSAGVPYFSAAGNDNAYDAAGHDIASYEAPALRPVACPSAVPASACHDFDASSGSDATYGITVPAGGELTLDLQWAQPWDGVTTNLDAYLLSASGSSVLTRSTDVNTGTDGTQVPFELVDWTNTASSARTVQLVIARSGAGGGDSATPRLKVVNLESAPGETLERPAPTAPDVAGPSVYGHSGAAGAVSVAAESVQGATAPESYSSRGPVTHYFGPVRADGTPAAALATPQTLAKPDLMATDCADGTVFEPFCGTSAAAPHAAAVAALAQSAVPTATRAQVVDAMTQSARPLAGSTTLDEGAGLVDAVGTLAALGAAAHPSSPTATPFFATTGELTSADASSTVRLGRPSAPSGCGATPGTAPFATGGSGSRYAYDAYGFANLTNETQCIRVDLVPGAACRTAAGGVYSATYVPGFTPSSPLTNLGGQEGEATETAEPGSYFVAVAAGTGYAVEVNALASGGTCSGYALSLDSQAPYATALPTVTGDAEPGGVLSATAGSWSGTPALGYQWRRCDASGGSCADIAGATDASYPVVAADAGHALKVRVAATQGGRTSTADSAPAGVPAPAPAPAPPAAVAVAPSPSTPVAASGARTPPRTTARQSGAGTASVTPTVVRHGRLVAFTFRLTSRRAGVAVVVRIDGHRHGTVTTTRGGAGRFHLRLRRGRHRVTLVATGARARTTAVRAR